MGKEYKLVELTEDEKNKFISLRDKIVYSCNKCIAADDLELCESLPECFETSYFTEVEKDDK